MTVVVVCFRVYDSNAGVLQLRVCDSNAGVVQCDSSGVLQSV